MATEIEQIPKLKPKRARQPKPTMNEMQERLETIREITKLFNMERYIYISVCGFAGILVLINAVMLTIKGIDAASLTLLFGSGGLITYSAGRLIYMWNRVVSIIFEQSDVKGGGINGNK